MSWFDARTAYIIVLVKSNTMHRRGICSSAERQNGRTVNMTGTEIGIILLVVAYLLHFIVFASYTAQTDRELYELRHRVTMLEMQRKDGDNHEG